MRNKVLGWIVACGLLPAAALSGGCTNYEIFFPPLDTAGQVDLSRYIGSWYEIAKYPTSFQTQCFGAVTAEYSLNDDGSIRVVNTCREGALDGPESTIEGTATVADTTTNAKLNVSFFPPFAAPYWIIDLDAEYQWAVVGEPSRSFLWILSRTPQMDDATYQDILSRLPDKGYDVSKLELTPQPETE